MSAIVSLAYLHWGPELHLGTNPAQRFEGIRQLATAMASLVQGSGREAAEGQMLYGAHVFARAKVIPDMALERGEQAYEHARSLGDGNLEFLSAIGLAHEHLELGDVDEAETWLNRAADRAAAVPTPHRARQVAIVGALIDGARGNPDGMVEGLRKQRAWRLRSDAPLRRPKLSPSLHSRPPAWERSTKTSRCSRSRRAPLGRRGGWPARCPGGRRGWPRRDAAESRVATARGETQVALDLARSARTALHMAQSEDPHFEILLPAARAILAAGDPEEQGGMARGASDQPGFRRVAHHGRKGSNSLVPRSRRQRAGRARRATHDHGAMAPRRSDQQVLNESESALLQLLVQGRSNSEIGEELGLEAAGVTSMLSALYARIGTSSRAETTAFAFRSV